MPFKSLIDYFFNLSGVNNTGFVPKTELLIDFHLNASSLNSRLDSLFVTGYDWSPGTRLIVQLQSKKNIQSTELHYACSTDFGDGEVVVVGDNILYITLLLIIRSVG